MEIEKCLNKIVYNQKFDSDLYLKYKEVIE